MYRCNEKNWPVVIHEFAGVQTPAAHEASLRQWNLHFLQKEPFIMVRIFHDEDALIHPEGAAKMTKNWLREGACEQIKHQVIAMLNIVPESAWNSMKHMSVEAVFGVPGGIFKNLQGAIIWLNSHIGDTVITPEIFRDCYY